MELQQEIEKIDGSSVNTRFTQMIKDYGVMTLCVDAKVLAEEQAAISDIHSELDIDSQDLQSIISKQYTEADEEILKMPNCCGDTSNYVCSIFLSEENDKAFRTMDYHELTEEDATFLESLPEEKDMLVRFEIDKQIPPSDYKAILYDPTVTTIEALITKVTDDPNYLQYKPLIVLPNSLIKIDVNNNKITTKSYPISTEMFKKFTVDYEQDIKNGIVMMADDEDCELAHFAASQFSREPTWRSSHSFTAFIPRLSSTGERPVFEYHAYFGSHSLDQWIQSENFRNTAQSGVKAFAHNLSELAQCRGPEEVGKKEAELFHFLPAKKNNAVIYAVAPQVKVKYKVIEVEPEIVNQNLNNITMFVDQYPGNSASEKVASYKSEALSNYLTCLQNQANEFMRSPTTILLSDNQLSSVSIDKTTDFKKRMPRGQVDHDHDDDDDPSINP